MMVNSRKRRRQQISSFFSILWTCLCLFTTTATARSKSYYDILGVAKNSTPQEIKKAYRKKALQHHPDKGGDEEEFKEITKSYETLSNSETRNVYDAYGEAGVLPGAGPSAASYSFGGGNPFAGAHPFGGNNNGGDNPFQGFFSGFSPGGQNSFGGGNIDISEILQQMMGGGGGGASSGRSSGFGRNPGFGSPPNHHHGRPSSSSFTRNVVCSLEELATGGTKKMKVTFREGTEKVYTVHLKPGWKEGTKVTFRGSSTLSAMTFVIQQAPHKYLRRDGNDLHYTVWLSESQTKGGVNVKIPLPTGDVWSKLIPKSDETVVSNGEKMVIPSKGMPIKGGPERGDLIVEFRIRRSSATTSS